MTGEGFAYSGAKTLGNARVFLVGKMFSAAVTVVWLGLQVRLVDLQNYATYVTVMAAIEAGIALSSVGVEWLLLRYIPEYVLHGAMKKLRTFLMRALALRISAGLLVGGVGLLILALWAPQGGALTYELWVLAAVLLLSEGSMRLLRENVLESMGRQGFMQIGMVLRTTSLLVLTASQALENSTLDAKTLVSFEIVASFITLAYAAAVVVYVTRMDAEVPGSKWKSPEFMSAYTAGVANYTSSLLSFPLSLQALLLMVSKIGQTQEVALFGFIVRLLDVMRGYLPALMFMSVLRPRFIGLYALTGTLRVVTAEALRASRLSTLSIAPLIAIVVLYGDELIGLASGGKITSGKWELAILMCSLMPRVHRQISVVLVNCVDHARLLLRAALIALCVLPVAWLVGMAISPVWGAVLAVVLDEAIWVVALVAGLQSAGHSWDGNWMFALRAALCAGVVAFCVSLIPFGSSTVDLVVGSGIVLVAFSILAILTGTLRLSELRVLVRR